MLDKYLGVVGNHYCQCQTCSSHNFVVTVLFQNVTCHGQALEVLAKYFEVLDKHLGILVNHKRVLGNHSLSL
jgi:hypothetical protein